MITKKQGNVGITVLMPTYRQAHFILRAINSLKLQSFQNWELIIINDGSPDNTCDIVQPLLVDSRIKYEKNAKNEGLGYCLNKGIKQSGFDLIAYLPSDDIYYHDHLETLFIGLEKNSSAVLIYSDARSDNAEHEQSERKSTDEPTPIQLVQVLHKKTDDWWTERSELVSDDYTTLFFSKLAKRGEFVYETKTTCEWINHPEQRTRIINEKFGGGLYKYKLFYNVRQPIIFQSSFGSYINEIERYKNFRKRPASARQKSLKILLVGELAFNPERICALEEHGHKLYGLWMKEPVFFNTIGPLPFGNVEDIGYENWKVRVHEIQPDIIYGLLNWQTIRFAHEVLMANTGIPFVWHFKENPFACMRHGLFKQLVDLYTLCNGRIFTNQLTEDWFNQVLPPKEIPSFILDGDLPNRKWFYDNRSPLLSEQDGQIHTVLAGRAIGFKPEYIKSLADQHIHIHIYGEIYQNLIKGHLKNIPESISKFLHFHPGIDQSGWVKEFSQYDAGWLHLFDSYNGGQLMKVNWNDLNYPARMATFAVAGVPMLMKSNTGHLVASQHLTETLDIGIRFSDINRLQMLFDDTNRMQVLRENVWNSRNLFQFDYYIDELIAFFQLVIKKQQVLKLCS